MARGAKAPPTPKTDLPLVGGGTRSGSLDIDTSEYRGSVRKSRNAKKNLTVAGALFEDMSLIDVKPKADGKPKPALTQFVDALQRLAVEHEKSPGENLLEPYRQAMSRLADEDPVKAAGILQALEAAPASESRLSPDVQEQNAARRKALATALLQENPDATAMQAKAASLTPEDAEDLRTAQDLKAAIQSGRELSAQQEAAPNMEGMQKAGLAQEVPLFDDTRHGRNMVRQLATLELGNPNIEGLVDAGTDMAPAPVDPGALKTRADFPVSLQELMGEGRKHEKFFYEDREPDPSKTFFPMLKPYHNIRLLADMSGKPFVPGLPAESSTVGKLTKGKPDSPSAEGSVGDYYSYDVGKEPAVAEALRLIDQNVQLGADLQPDMAKTLEVMRKKNPLGLATDLQHQVRELLAGGPSRGRVMLRHGTSPSVAAGLERQIMREGRSPLKKHRDSLFSVLEGTSRSAPRGIQRLIPSESKIRGMPADELLTNAGFTSDQVRDFSPSTLNMTVDSLRQRMIDKAAEDDFTVQTAINNGGIVPLEQISPYFPANFQYLDPVDLQRYEGPLPPELLSHTMMQQLLLDDPRLYPTLEPAVRRSMGLYQQFPPHGRMLDFMEGRDPDGPPKTFTPTKAYDNKIRALLESLGLPLPEIKRRPNPLAPPGMFDSSMTAPRFDQTMLSPVASLIG